MIYYATKETLQRYKLKTPEQFESEMAPFVRAVVNRERGNRLFEWGSRARANNAITGSCIRRSRMR